MDIGMLIIAGLSLIAALMLYNSAEKNDALLGKAWYFMLFVVFSFLAVLFAKASIDNKTVNESEYIVPY